MTRASEKKRMSNEPTDNVLYFPNSLARKLKCSAYKRSYTWPPTYLALPSDTTIHARCTRWTLHRPDTPPKRVRPATRMSALASMATCLYSFNVAWFLGLTAYSAFLLHVVPLRHWTRTSRLGLRSNPGLLPNETMACGLRRGRRGDRPAQTDGVSTKAATGRPWRSRSSRRARGFSHSLKDLCPFVSGPTLPPGSGLRSYRFIFMLANLVHGCSTVPFYTLSVAYMDDNLTPQKSSWYIGIYYTAAIMGPGVGFILAGMFLGIYTDVSVDPSSIGMSPSSNVWIGAWWIGFVITGFSALLISLPTFGFPKRLPDAVNTHEAHEVDFRALKGDTLQVRLADMPRAVFYLVQNYTFLFISLATTVEMMIGSGYSNFVTKLFESQFGMTSSGAALLLGYSRPSAAATACVPSASIPSAVGTTRCTRHRAWPAAATRPRMSRPRPRCVMPKQKSFALGVQWACIRLLGTIPAPLIFGKAVDMACEIWSSVFDGDTNDSGHCAIYDNGALSRNMAAMLLLLKTMSVVLFACASFTYQPTTTTSSPT
ncbi:solute carrier organic anion transporter family member 4A1-like isoform X4 [Dermacentor andersoni]|uniref:solute carrier organic anion transporter family member 4A1-like isoform X4 n=1 Tax=Dermacentor andersoni TaxID=34620 RepID=UPI003B3A52E8